MLKKIIAIVLLVLIIGSVSLSLGSAILSLIYATLSSLQGIVRDVYHGAVHLVQSQPLWIQIVLGVILIAQFLSLLDWVGGIFLTPEMSWGERVSGLSEGIALFIGSLLVMLLCLPLLIMQLKFMQWLWPVILICWGLRAIWWGIGKTITFYQTWRLSKSRQFPNTRRRSKRIW